MDELIKEQIDLLRSLLAADDRVRPASIKTGPRQNELYFMMADGRFRVLAIAVRESI